MHKLLRAQVASPQAAAEIAQFLKEQGYECEIELGNDKKYRIYTAVPQKPVKNPIQRPSDPLLTATEREFAYWIAAVLLGFLFIKYVL